MTTLRAQRKQMTPSPDHQQPTDARARPMRDLRISVTDRCNLRCTYCMPAEIFTPDYQFLPKADILSFEEIHAVAASCVANGVTKLRLTGGEPLLRKDLPVLIRSLRAIEGVTEIALTTNGLLLKQLAPALKDAGLTRVTVSLDALSNEVFRTTNGGRSDVEPVLQGIHAAVKAGFTGIKVNCVVQKGVNDGEILPMVDYFHRNGQASLRFIEFMDVGSTNGWSLDKVLPSRDILALIATRYQLETRDPLVTGEVARRFAIRDSAGRTSELGCISSVTQPFCRDCNRLRLSARGELYTCLFASSGTDVRDLLRSGADHDQLTRFIANLWRARDDRYSELRSSQTPGLPKVEMSYIGG